MKRKHPDNPVAVKRKQPHSKPKDKKKKLRFLNMKPEQMRRRYIRKKVRAFRKKRKNSAEIEHDQKRQRKREDRAVAN